MRINEIVLDEKSENEKRKIIEKNLGNEVILKDEHEKWNHGILSKYEEKGGCYKIQMKDKNREKRFWYNDLKQLLVIY